MDQAETGYEPSGSAQLCGQTVNLEGHSDGAVSWNSTNGHQGMCAVIKVGNPKVGTCQSTDLYPDISDPATCDLFPRWSCPVSFCG